MHKLAALDRRYVWHPFTQMRDWAKREPIVLVRGKGAVLEGLLVCFEVGIGVVRRARKSGE